MNSSVNSLEVSIAYASAFELSPPSETPASEASPPNCDSSPPRFDPETLSATGIITTRDS